MSSSDWHARRQKLCFTSEYLCYFISRVSNEHELILVAIFILLLVRDNCLHNNQVLFCAGKHKYDYFLTPCLSCWNAQKLQSGDVDLTSSMLVGSYLIEGFMS